VKEEVQIGSVSIKRPRVVAKPAQAQQIENKVQPEEKQVIQYQQSQFNPIKSHLNQLLRRKNSFKNSS